MAFPYKWKGRMNAPLVTSILRSPTSWFIPSSVPSPHDCTTLKGVPFAPVVTRRADPSHLPCFVLHWWQNWAMRRLPGNCHDTRLQYLIRLCNACKHSFQTAPLPHASSLHPKCPSVPRLKQEGTSLLCNI